ncbi:outer membrane protein P1 [Neisseria meningitidis]|nr:outer membrane protein P1 [Neisseria meningitidis]
MSDHLIRPNVDLRYSGLNLNQYGVASPCRTICTVCGFVSRFLLILYTMVLIFVNTIKMPSETVSVPCPDFC